MSVRYSRVVCVLSGGGAKSAAHVGALKALSEWDLSPSHFVGTSMGAVIGAIFGSGLTYDEALVRLSNVKRRDVAALSLAALLGPFAHRLLKNTPLRNAISTLVPARRFDELETPLTVTAVDRASGELVLFGYGGRSDIPLIEALVATCALPVFYPPVAIGARDYVDGGLRAVLPLDIAAGFDPDVVFAVNVGPTLAEPEGGGKPLPGMLQAHNMTTRILMANQIGETVARWRGKGIPLVLVEPAVEPGATFAVGNMTVYLEEGYRAAYRALNAWKEGR